MTYQVLTGASGSTPSIRVTDPGSHWQTQAWHMYVDGTFSSATVSLEYSPDDSYISDAASHWFTSTSVTMTAKGNTWLSARFRKYRFTWSGGGAGTSLVAELV